VYTQRAHTQHTPTNSAPVSGLAQWTDKKLSGLGSRVQSRLDPCTQRTSEQWDRRYGASTKLFL